MTTTIEGLDLAAGTLDGKPLTEKQKKDLAYYQKQVATAQADLAAYETPDVEARIAAAAVERQRQITARQTAWNNLLQAEVAARKTYFGTAAPDSQLAFALGVNDFSKLHHSVRASLLKKMREVLETDPGVLAANKIYNALPGGYSSEIKDGRLGNEREDRRNTLAYIARMLTENVEAIRERRQTRKTPRGKGAAAPPPSPETQAEAQREAQRAEIVAAVKRGEWPVELIKQASADRAAADAVTLEGQEINSVVP